MMPTLAAPLECRLDLARGRRPPPADLAASRLGSVAQERLGLDAATADGSRQDEHGYSAMSPRPANECRTGRHLRARPPAEPAAAVERPVGTRRLTDVRANLSDERHCPGVQTMRDAGPETAGIDRRATLRAALDGDRPAVEQVRDRLCAQPVRRQSAG